MNSETATLSIKQRFNILAQKLNSAIIDEKTGLRKDDLFVDHIMSLVERGVSFHSRLSVEKIAQDDFGFTDKQFIKELTEYAIIKIARGYARKYSFDDAYQHMVNLYHNQPYSTHQTNVSVELNQYSTPIPIGYLMGKYIGLNYDNHNPENISYEEFENIYFNYLSKWIDLTDTAKLTFISIKDTNWYPTKVFVKYAKEKEFDYGAEKPNFLEYIKNGGIIPPIIVEKSKGYQVDEKGNLLKNKPLRPTFFVRDGIHRISIYEELGIDMIPALVYSKADKSASRSFDGGIDHLHDLEKFIGITLKEFYKEVLSSRHSDEMFFEPTAGNGMLTISGDPSSIIVNEIDRDRLHVLKKQHFREILFQDATKPFPFDKKFDGVISNPPFAGSQGTIIINDYHISGLDQQIIVKSLEYMKDSGKSAFIIG